MQEALRKYKLLRWLFIGAVVYFVGVLWWSTFNPNVPMRVIRAVPEKRLIAMGERPNVSYYFVRYRNCQGTVQGVWNDDQGNDLSRTPIKPTVATQEGSHWATVSLEPPPSPGTRCYDSTIRYKCGGGDNYDVVSPSVCFTVVQ